MAFTADLSVWDNHDLMDDQQTNLVEAFPDVTPGSFALAPVQHVRHRSSCLFVFVCLGFVRLRLSDFAVVSPKVSLSGG